MSSSGGLASLPVRDRIIRSLFNEKNDTGATVESYITHVKIYEDVEHPTQPPPQPTSPDKLKERYILLSVLANGRVRMHKSRGNENGTFQIGKTWNLDDLQKVQDTDRRGMIVTLLKPYYWTMESVKDKYTFVSALTKVYKKYTGGRMFALIDFDPQHHPPKDRPEDRPPAAGRIAPDQGSRKSPASQTTAPLRSQRSISDLQNNRMREMPRDSPKEVPRETIRQVSQSSTTGRSQMPPDMNRETIRQVSQSSTTARSQMPPETNRGIPGSRTASSQYGGPDRDSVRQPSQSALSSPPFRGQRLGSESMEDKLRRGVPIPENALGFRPINGERRPSADRGLATSPSVPDARSNQRQPPLGSPMEYTEIKPQHVAVPASVQPARSLRRIVIEEPGVDLAPPIRNGDDFRSTVSPPPPAKSPARRPTNPRTASTSSARAMHDRLAGLTSPVGSGASTPVPEVPQLPTKSEARSADSPKLERPDLPWKSPMVDKPVEKPAEDYFTSMPGDRPSKPSTITSTVIGMPKASDGPYAAPQIPAVRHDSISKAFQDMEIDDETVYLDEVIRDFKWTSQAGTDTLSRKLQDELSALDAANVYAIVENDDRIEDLMKRLDQGIAQCDDMANLLTIYEFEMETVNEHIQHIEGQSQGLQVQTANQLALVEEITSVLTSITISETDLEVLKGRHGNLESPDGISNIEKSLINLFKALKSMQDEQRGGEGMSALNTKSREYVQESNAFLSRLGTYLEIKFQAALLSKERKSTSSIEPARVIEGHEDGFVSLMPYAALILYARAIDPDGHANYMRNYASAAKASWHDAIINFAGQWRTAVKKATQEENEMIFTAARDHQTMGAARNATLKRSNTLAKQIRSVTSTKPDKDVNDGKLPASEVFRIILDNLALILTNEQNFLTTFFHLSSTSAYEFSDYVELDMKSRFSIAALDEHRQTEPNRTLAKERLLIMESIFGWLSSELTRLVDEFAKLDPIQVIGIIKSIEVVHTEWTNTDQEFMLKLLTKLKEKLTGLLIRFIDAQLRAIKDLKVTSKKRKGIVPVFEIFPDFVERIEVQLYSTDSGEIDPAHLDIRATINESYEQLSKAMFDSVRTLASSTSMTSQGLVDPEDKEALNYHILMVQNMHQYLETLQSRDNPILESFKLRAQENYNEHLNAYTRQIILRPIGRLHEFTEAVEKQIKMQEDPTTKSAFSPTSLKRLLGDYDERDIRKGISAMWKRVDKHFSDDEGSITGLLPVIWRSTQIEYMSVIDRFLAILQDKYPQVHVDWTRQSITTAFAKREA